MTIARDANVGRGYLARESATGNIVWCSARDTHLIRRGTARVSIGGRPGQIVFTTGGTSVWPPNTALT